MANELPKSDRADRLAKSAACALVFIAVCVTFGPSIWSPFVFDDHLSIVRNESVRTLWPLSVPLSPPKYAPFSGRPLVNLSAAFNFGFGRYDPTGYHVFNILVHAGSAMLLFLILWRALTLYHSRSYSLIRGHYAPFGLAFAIALLWAVHPLQIDAVCYVTQRTELMMGFFLLATLYCSIRYWDSHTQWPRTSWLALAILASAAGMACKEVMVAAPLLVLLFERTFLNRSFFQALRNSAQLYVGLAATLLVLVYLNMDMPRADSAGFHLDVSAPTWWLTQCKVLLLYVRLAFWPWPLSIHHEIRYVHSLAEGWMYVLPVTVLILGTVFASWRAWPVGYLGCWFFIILSPTLVVPIVTEVAAERRMYMPLISLVALIVVGGYRVAIALTMKHSSTNRKDAKQAGRVALAMTLVAAPAIAFGAVSWHRLADFRDEETLWRNTLRHYPASETAHQNLGFALMNSEEYDEAIDEFREALRLNPNGHEAHFNWGTVLNEQGSIEEAADHFATAAELAPNKYDYHRMYGVVLSKLRRYHQAIEQYNYALQLQPDSGVIHYNLGLALKNTGHPEEAARHYAEAVRLAPNDAEARNNYGNSLRTLKRYEEALAQFAGAIKLDPELRSARLNLALTLESLGRKDEAVAEFEHLIELHPDDDEAHYALGNVYLTLGQQADAINQFQEAVRLDPSRLEAWNNLGATLLDQGRVEEAIAALEKGAMSTPESPVTQFNLAVAYETAGRADEAATHARQALAMAERRGETEVVRQIRSWIASHVAPKPDDQSIEFELE